MTPPLLVLGDLMLDRYTWGDAERVSPEAPVLVLQAESDEVRLGGAASVAGLLAGLGARPLVAGVVGDDPEGRIVRRLLEEQELPSADGCNLSPVPCKVDLGLLLTDPSRSTTHKQRFLGRAAHHRAHQILRVDRESREPLEPHLAARLAVAAVTALPACGAVLISDYAKGVCTPRLLADVIAAARERRLPVLVDPARGVDYGRYRGASLIKPNRDEASAAARRPIGSPDEAIAAGRELCRRYGIAATVITLDVDGLVLVETGGLNSNEAGWLGSNEAGWRGSIEAGWRGSNELDWRGSNEASGCGANGLAWLGSNGERWRGHHFAARSRAVCDVTGAGDTVLAVLGLAAARHIDLATACRQAVLAAGLQVERLGVAPITWDEIQRSGIHEDSNSVGNALSRRAGIPRDGIRENPDAEDQRQMTKERRPTTHAKITSLDALVPLVSRHIAGGRRVVFTNGCFDLLHLGHARLLAQAKAAGDVLIVAINGDAGVERLKGPGRPVMREADRAGLIAALECVDHVVIFDDDTPERLIMSLRPDVLVKGADYRRADVIGRRFVESYGGRVLLADIVPDRSTTSTIERLTELGVRREALGAKR